MSGDLFLLPSSLNLPCPRVHSFDCIFRDDALHPIPSAVINFSSDGEF
jgi:hypothetical protein